VACCRVAGSSVIHGCRRAGLHRCFWARLGFGGQRRQTRAARYIPRVPRAVLCHRYWRCWRPFGAVALVVVVVTCMVFEPAPPFSFLFENGRCQRRCGWWLGTYRVAFVHFLVLPHRCRGLISRPARRGCARATAGWVAMWWGSPRSRASVLSLAPGVGVFGAGAVNVAPLASPCKASSEDMARVWHPRRCFLFGKGGMGASAASCVVVGHVPGAGLSLLAFRRRRRLSTCGVGFCGCGRAVGAWTVCKRWEVVVV
jgi:hypothetical protein